jgi:hypothetical protein
MAPCGGPDQLLFLEVSRQGPIPHPAGPGRRLRVAGRGYP